MDTVFDPNGVGVANGNYYGLPFTVAEAALVLVEAPWDVTVSYGDGTADGPRAIREASTQLDLYDADYPDAWRRGIAALPADTELRESSRCWRAVAQRVIDRLEAGGAAQEVADELRGVNEACREMNERIYGRCSQLLAAGKIVGLVGGDHSTPYGLVRAVAERTESFGILHFDAHRDLREAYEGFEFSHASIMYNLLRDIPQIGRIVQVGVRDFCDAEAELAERSARIVSFDDRELCRRRFEGESWAAQCARIVDALPERVYVSFDIDALEIQYCPHTGTPVVGGLTFNEAAYLLRRVCDSGRRIVGFDAVEVAPSHDSDIDQMAGARILYKLCCAALGTIQDKVLQTK